MQVKNGHGRLTAGAGVCLVTALALILAPSLAAGQVIKTAQIDCVGPAFTAAGAVTVDLRVRPPSSGTCVGGTNPGAACGGIAFQCTSDTTSCLGGGTCSVATPPPLICSATTPLQPVGTVCGSVGGPGNLMPTLRPLINTACLPVGVGATNVAGPGGAGASIIIQGKASFAVCVNGANVNPGPPGTVLADGAGGPSISNGGKLKTMQSPALSAQGVVIFLLLMTGVLFVIRRRRSTL